MSAVDALSRPATTLEDLRAGGFELETRASDEHLDRATFHAECKYRGYLKQHETQLARTRAQESREIPACLEYRGIPGLSREIVERLTAIRPATIGQASRVPGVTPAAVAILVARIRHGADADKLPT
jgi:tRNA uridine 5-carboxymethylaminomethyl modification enzyme